MGTEQRSLVAHPAGEPDLPLPVISGMDSITLSPEPGQYVVEAVAAGRYRDLSDGLTAGVALLRRWDAASAEADDPALHLSAAALHRLTG
jgi:hypothetical protein